MNRQKFLILLVVLLQLKSVQAQKRILIVTSNQHFYGNTKINASNHFEEIIVPYDVFTNAGFLVDFISPKGGGIPIGYINTSDSIQKRYLYDGLFMDKLENTRKPTDVIAANYLAIYFSGGGAAMYGIAEDTIIQKIARQIYKNDGVVSSICHGTAGLAFVKDENGKFLYEGKKITGFPDKFEDKKMDYYKAFPFSIDEAIKKNGGKFVHSDKERDGFYVVDGRFVTGQDPTSATLVARQVVELLKSKSQNSKDTIVKSDFNQIKEVLLDYIEGTANGQPERLRKAFHPNFNLYTISKDTLWTRSGEQYISNVKVGEKSNRTGRILSIDFEKDAAIAKAEIIVPNWRVFTDYFLLLKYQGAWKIVHKSYTWRELPKTEKK